MWCEQCKTDVATQMSTDGLALLCTTCGEQVQKVTVPSQHPETKSAREFLERWAREQQATRRVVQPGRTLAGTTPAASVTPSAASPQPISSEAETATKPATVSAIPTEVAELLNELPKASKKPIASPIQAPAQSGTAQSEPVVLPVATNTASVKADLTETNLRFDGEHQIPPQSRTHSAPQFRNPAQHSADSSITEKPASQNRQPETRPELITDTTSAAEDQHSEVHTAHDLEHEGAKNVRMDGHHQLVQGPHFPLAADAPRKTKMPGRIEAIWGQILAYLGVGTLTVGTALVLWGYFGDIAQYSSTGWLVATCGQMFLLLGIVTLVGGGMQQTTHEVSQRIDHLGGRIIRIEQSTDRILSSPIHRRERKRSSDQRDAA